ncbi:MAG: hypothetical protein AB1705_26010, partial [Verrucomicrobiota bacterium]
GVWLLMESCLAWGQVRPIWIARYDNDLPSKVHDPLGMALDKQGDLIVAGSSRNAQGDSDYMVLKYSAAGALLWSARYSSAAHPDDMLRGFAVDAAGNICLTGTSETVKIGADGKQLWTAPYGGRSVAVDALGQVYVTGFLEDDFATAKLSALGSLVWTRTYDYAGFKWPGDHSQVITVDRAGGVLVAGVANWDENPRGGGFVPLLIKYSSEGTLAWTIHLYDKGSFGRLWEIKSLVLDQQENIFVTMNYESGPTYQTTKIRAVGTIEWSNWVGGAGSEGVTAGVLNSAGAYYLTGRRIRSRPNVVFQTYKIENSGNLAWFAEYFGPMPGYHKANAIALDRVGSVYVTGISPAPNTGNDWATIKYDPTGKELWVQRYNGGDEAKAIAVDDTGNVFVTGYATTPQGGREIVTIKYAQASGISLKHSGHSFVQFIGTPGVQYRIQATTNFTSWLDRGAVTADGLGIFQLEDSDAPNIPFRFYRSVTP